VVSWKIWMAVSAVLTAGELLIVGRAPETFYFGSLILGAIAAAIVSAAGVGWVGEVSVFVAASAVAFVLLRPIVSAHIHAEAEARRERDDHTL
jgi:membrane protein implicated in regulation of membrane protease activity